MPAIKRFYWDTCAWLGVINGEPDKRADLEVVLGLARRGLCKLWTSTYTLVEANRYAEEKNQPKPLSAENLLKIERFFQQPFIKLITVDMEIARRARQLHRETAKLSKRPDAVHLASALRWPVDAMHTYDGSDLLHLSGKFRDDKGQLLTICTPHEETHGPLFAQIRA